MHLRSSQLNTRSFRKPSACCREPFSRISCPTHSDAQPNSAVLIVTWKRVYKLTSVYVHAQADAWHFCTNFGVSPECESSSRATIACLGLLSFVTAFAQITPPAATCHAAGQPAARPIQIQRTDKGSCIKLSMPSCTARSATCRHALPKLRHRCGTFHQATDPSRCTRKQLIRADKLVAAVSRIGGGTLRRSLRANHLAMKRHPTSN